MCRDKIIKMKVCIILISIYYFTYISFTTLQTLTHSHTHMQYADHVEKLEVSAGRRNDSVVTREVRSGQVRSSQSDRSTSLKRSSPSGAYMKVTL